MEVKEQKKLLRKALEEPVVEGLEVISSEDKEGLIRLLSLMPDGSIVSEWRYGPGVINYRYRLHSSDTGQRLMECIGGGSFGGLLKLTAVYTKDDIEKMISSPAGVAE